MSGRHVQSAAGGHVRFWLAGLGIALAALLVATLAGPADASSKTLAAQLSLSGLASSDNPLGGSQIGIHPGDDVSFAAAGVPTAGLQKAGLNGLLDGVTGLLAKFQVNADFSGLPGGAKNTVLSGSAKTTFAFPKKGTYKFTWSFQSVNLLGGVTTLPPLDFSGNQLKQLGITLNASNQYVGKVVVATNPPPGGLSLQVPSIAVAPSAPVVGQLPTLTIPGVNLPTVDLTVPDLNPGSTAPTASSSTGSTSGTSSAATPGPQLSFNPPGVSVPQLVVPGVGGGGGSNGGSGGNGGFRLGVSGTDSNGQLAVGDTGSGTGSTSGSGGEQAADGTRTVDLASSSSSPSGQLPVLLAILAVITLAMVAGIYARLYLLGRKPSAG